MSKAPFIAFMIIALCSAVYADFGLEFRYSQSFTDNLLLDRSNLKDTYSSSSLALSFYPLPQIETKVNGEYTYYQDLTGLGNILGGGSVTVIPTPSDWPVSIYMNGSYQSRWYRNLFEVYNTRDISGILSVGLKLAPAIQLRAGCSYKKTAFVNSEQADKEISGVFSGLNISFLGANSLDMETGYSFAQLRVIDTSTIYAYPPKIEELDGDLKSFYFSPRYSRPLGKRIGMAITYYFAQFLGDDEQADSSYSTGLLSPWASVWEGNSITLNLKSYLMPKMVMTAGIGYWNKQYIKTLRLPDWLEKRKDDLSRYYVGFSWPMPSSSGVFLEPSLQINLSNCTSSLRLFDYSDFSVTVGFLIRM